MIDAEFLRKYVPNNELRSLLEGTRGEEGAYFAELIQKTIEMIKNVPPLGSNEEIGLQAPVKLHYFGGGSDWWITELDPDDRIAFGFVCLNGMTDCAELGYISIEELLSVSFPVEINCIGEAEASKRFMARCEVELDLHWKEKPLGEIMKEVRKKQ